jgi:hypothetical protein
MGGLGQYGGRERPLHAQHSPASMPNAAMDAIIRNDPEVLVDEAARHVRSLLSGSLDQMYHSRP